MAERYPEKLEQLRARVNEAYGAVMAEWNKATPFLLELMRSGQEDVSDAA